MKPTKTCPKCGKALVAPRAGAWVETRYVLVYYLSRDVAPRAGAWVETITKRCLPLRVKSHPVRVRGLKLLICGLWTTRHKSHPVRVRGLKLQARKGRKKV